MDESFSQSDTVTLLSSFLLLLLLVAAAAFLGSMENLRCGETEGCRIVSMNDFLEVADSDAGFRVSPPGSPPGFANRGLDSCQ